MEGRALTIDELIAAMHDIRLPADAPGGFLAELFAAIGVGLAIALLFGWVLSKFTVRPKKQELRTIEQRVAEVKDLTEESKVTELLHILKVVDPVRATSFSASIYERNSLPDASSIEQAIRNAQRADA